MRGDREPSRALLCAGKNSFPYEGELKIFSLMVLLFKLAERWKPVTGQPPAAERALGARR